MTVHKLLTCYTGRSFPSNERLRGKCFEDCTNIFEYATLSHTFLESLVLRFQLLHLVRELLVGLTRHTREVVDLGDG